VWRHFFGLGAAIGSLALSLQVVSASEAAKQYQHLTTHAHHVQNVPPSTVLDRALHIIPTLWGETAALFFVVDAVRRKYRGGGGVALGMAIFGLLSAGMGSLVYYALWGRSPLERASGFFSQGLCAKCVSSTTDKPAPSSQAFQVVLGTRYMGADDRCSECQSVVRTLWFWFGLPLVPLGSYRIVTTDIYHFRGRRTALRWPQVLTVYAITVILAGLFGLLYFRAIQT
jgi:hypothetical protein